MDLFRLALGANGMNVERRTIVLSERGSAEKRRLGKMSSPIGRRWLRCGQPEKYLRSRPPEILITINIIVESVPVICVHAVARQHNPFASGSAAGSLRTARVVGCDMRS